MIFLRFVNSFYILFKFPFCFVFFGVTDLKFLIPLALILFGHFNDSSFLLLCFLLCLVLLLGLMIFVKSFSSDGSLVGSPSFIVCILSSQLFGIGFYQRDVCIHLIYISEKWAQLSCLQVVPNVRLHM